jgi:phosphoribosylamine--glycine ligase
MKVLVIGSGGREHSLVWKLDQSPRVSKIYCAPGNAGISELAECIPISAEDIKGLLDFAVKQKIDLTLVGPEVSLTLGVVDAFEKRDYAYSAQQKRRQYLRAVKFLPKNLCRIIIYHLQIFRFSVSVKGRLNMLSVPEPLWSSRLMGWQLAKE